MRLRTSIIQNLIGINERIVFYPALKRFYKKLPIEKPLKIIDVGSNKGQSIDFFLSIDPGAKIYGFEPNEKLFRRLKNKYGNYSNIELQNCGLSDKTGKLVFHENILDETSTFEELNQASGFLKKKAKILGVQTKEIIASSYEVEVVSLTDFIEKKEIETIDILKIDVEGHEYKVLCGLFAKKDVKRNIRYIQLEHHNDDMYLNSNAEKINGLLNQNSFFEIARFKHGFGDFFEIIFENRSKL